MKSKLAIPDNYDFIIVDYGSDSARAVEIKNTCADIGFDYVYVDKPNGLWNASAARNIGLKNQILTMSFLKMLICIIR